MEIFIWIILSLVALGLVSIICGCIINIIFIMKFMDIFK